MKHLTAAQRGNIETLLQEKYTNKEIARRLGKDPSTISREIKKGMDGSGTYRAWVAQVAYETNRKRCKQIPKLDHPANWHLRSHIVACLQKGWDPSMICGRLKAEGFKLVVCAETVYDWIYHSAYAIAEKLYQYLRQGKKRRTKHTGRSSQRSKIPNRVSIHERPTVVDEKSRVGDWEGDSVTYTHKHAINTVNERLSSLVAFTKLTQKTAVQTAQAVIAKLRPLVAHTITFDNGSEFTLHGQMTEVLGVSVYFADPYSSWQRGANENSNRQLRAYLPKRSDIRNLTQKELDNIAWELNNKPRRRLNWHTPQEVYDWLVQHPDQPLDLTQVAFGSRI
ncbi:IS30 family transposase [Candidatus Saccharibacteria bacterium CPR2]|nr:IS30 family transposase [Candidatus Saccharibacteria bacterium CPR2]